MGCLTVHRRFGKKTTIIYKEINFVLKKKGELFPFVFVMVVSRLGRHPLQPAMRNFRNKISNSTAGKFSKSSWGWVATHRACFRCMKRYSYVTPAATPPAIGPTHHTPKSVCSYVKRMSTT
jgi:hypothetical protein